MKPRSKTFLSAALGLLAWALLAPACAEEPGIFTLVPAGDVTYVRLERLAKADLLDPKAVGPPLTRFEVARLIHTAREKFEGIALAQVGDEDLLLAPAGGGGAGGDDLLLTEPGLEGLGEAAKELTTLEEAYDHELKSIQRAVEGFKEGVRQTEDSQAKLARTVEGITGNPSISLHGRGRGQAAFQRVIGLPFGPIASYPTEYGGQAFLDLEPTGAVSRELTWKGMVRLHGSLLPDNSTNAFALRRVEIHLRPQDFSLDFGDYYEAYTPLTLWNRPRMDLMAAPEMVARREGYHLYESFFQRAPEWPLRGVRAGFGFEFPGSPLEGWDASVFAHMIRNGYDRENSAYFGPGVFTEWVFGGSTRLLSKSSYFAGGASYLAVEGHGVLMDSFPGTNTPGTVYLPMNPGTWMHQYVLGSLRPQAEVGFGGGFALGGRVEMAGAFYHDDKMDGSRTFNDWAQFGGPYLKLEDSIFAFNFLNVGPYYYAPTAQIRQDRIAEGLGGGMDAMDHFHSPEGLWPHRLKGSGFITGVGRPGLYFSFYDRTQDNVFPYGMATPNREGWGFELDVKSLQKKALRLRGAFYQVHEIGGNLVVNPMGTGFDPVDAPPGPPPVRDFTYVNAGVAVNIGPLAELSTDLEFTANVRAERTDSSIGQLDGLGVWAGVRAGLNSWLELSGAVGHQRTYGMEAGFLGTTLARYPYLLDNSDLGSYANFQVDGQVLGLLFSLQAAASRNSRLILDLSLNQGSHLYFADPGHDLVKHYGEIVYEIEF